MYPILTAPHSAPLPLITYQRITTQSINHLKGTTSLANIRLQLNLTGRTHAEARQLAEAVRLALDTRTGEDVEVCRLISDQDAPEPATDGSNEHYHTIQQEYRIWYRRSVPDHS